MTAPRTSARGLLFLATGALGLAALTWLLSPGGERLPPTPAATRTTASGSTPLGSDSTRRRVTISAGAFEMGIDGQGDASPAHTVHLEAFAIDVHEVTNAEFAEFVEQTRYITTAEQRGSSRVFSPSRRRWLEVAGADWRHPRGPDDSLIGRERLPVVHVSWRDATAYGRWAGGRLPTEAEWERAARGGLRGADFPWGYESAEAAGWPANTWQGLFPLHDEALDGVAGLAPVGSRASNRLGVRDMAGNVREWCHDSYLPDAYQRSASRNPRFDAGGERVLRGGSWLSADDPRPEYAVWRRHHAADTHTDNQTGFRLVGPAETADR